ncbi:uncharacterized protein LOC107627215 [Arachis ipaensis]|uniref:uncharacterized protein LOC107627215 n=1 Tax=Arachis ipaensis TaxID=130454 RepID=UPI0007AFADAE|nr:uncharacterized protein LOC107627215 [Arachis ipaensis]
MLEGEAEYWWQGIQRLLQQNEGDIPWDTFRDEFYKKYFSRAARDAKEIELMQLKQEDMIIAEYAHKFDDLCRFSKICQGNPADFEEWKCLNKLVEECSKKAAIARADRREASRRDLIQNLAPQGRNFKANDQYRRQNRNQRNGDFFARNNNNNHNYNLGQERGGQSQGISICSRYGKDHGNRLCQYGTKNCYTCGEPGHMARACPNRFVQNPARTQLLGRISTMTIDDALYSDSVIQG